MCICLRISGLSNMGHFPVQNLLSIIVNHLCNVSTLLFQCGSLPSILGMRITVFSLFTEGFFKCFSQTNEIILASEKLLKWVRINPK